MSFISRWIDRLACPVCYAASLTRLENDSGLFCPACGASFPIIGGKPVLLRPNHALFDPKQYRNATGNSEAGRGWWKSIVPRPSENLARDRLLRDLAARIATIVKPAVLVVGVGRQRDGLAECMAALKGVDLVCMDVDRNADVDCFCDAHDLPFKDAVFDAVITTAVLEHVMYPERAAAEIHRVLASEGLLYSELPFMQQVHEGAYDFTRYSLSGHRRLFNGFAEIDAGMVAGPGTALAWAIENFVLAFLHGRPARWAAKAAVRLVCFWLKYFDRLLVNKPQAMDGASCTYFFGRKILGQVPDETIIAAYVGAKHVSHL